MKISDAEITSLLFDEQGSDPATPASGFWRAFFKAGGLYVIDDTGAVTGPFGAGGGGGDVDTVAGVSPVSGDIDATDLADALKIRTKICKIVGTGNMTTTSGTFVAMDSTDLPWQAITGLVTGDWVHIMFSVSISHSSTAEAIYFDVEVDRPTSGDTRIGNDTEGLWRHTASGAARVETKSWDAWYEIGEDGTHQFRPMWYTSAATATAYNVTSGLADGLPISFVVEVVPNPQ